MIWLLMACASDPTLTVGAASSVRDVLPQLVILHYENSGERVDVTYAASGSIAAQLRAGAPLDAVVFAGEPPLASLIADGLVRGAPVTLAQNTLVVVGPKDRTAVGFDRLHTLDRVAIADPRIAPVGAYAQRVFTDLGTWDAVVSHAIQVPDVAASLALARRGEVDAAVVYATDVRLAPELVVWDTASFDNGGPVVIVASVGAAPMPFLATLAADEAKPLWRAAGFVVP